MSAPQTYSFIDAKDEILHFAKTLQKANSAVALRAAMLADTNAPYNSMDMLALIAVVENMGTVMAELMGQGLDADGVPV